jgi:hypothetical protein
VKKRREVRLTWSGNIAAQQEADKAFNNALVRRSSQPVVKSHPKAKIRQKRKSLVIRIICGVVGGGNAD